MATPAAALLSKSAVLIFSRDPVLLATREMILRAAGYEVWIATNLQDVSLIASHAPVSLLIVCHTVSKEECTRALSIAHSGSTKALVLTAGNSGCSNQWLDELLDVMDGPETFVATVAHLTKAKPAAHPQPPGA